MSSRWKFDRDAGGLVEIEHAGPSKGETMTAYMERLNREQREAEARQPLLDIDGNPWSRERWNLTNQMRVERRNPELAAELRRQAGVA